MVNDKIRIEKAKEKLHLIDTQTRTFYDVLREKLNWRGHPTYNVN
jgi:NAD kinase